MQKVKEKYLKTNILEKCQTFFKAYTSYIRPFHPFYTMIFFSCGGEMISVRPLDVESDFKCVQCLNVDNAEKVQDMLYKAKRIANSCLKVKSFDPLYMLSHFFTIFYYS